MGACCSGKVALTLLGNNPALISSPIFWLLLAGSVVVLAAFVWQEKRARDPIMDPELVVRQPFLVINVFGLLTGACFMGFFSFIPYYASVQYGMGPLESGAILTPCSLTSTSAGSASRPVSAPCAASSHPTPEVHARRRTA